MVCNIDTADAVQVAGQARNQSVEVVIDRGRREHITLGLAV